ncbi:MAG: OmpA family protein [Deltaproteobacteria bacterium]|nr:OmpA family protein [Deltaproteobacteria bacterium]
MSSPRCGVMKVLVPTVLAMMLSACGGSATQRGPSEVGGTRPLAESRRGDVRLEARPNGGGPGQGRCEPDSVYFAFDSSDLDRAAREVLSTNAAMLSSSPVRLRIVGMADPRGGTEYNLALGERRARSVARYLASQGVTGADVHSVGSELARGTDETSWAADRRAEIVGRSRCGR